MSSITLSSCVAMCTYNGEQFISEQLTSIINQKRIVDEIIISDDFSNDKTVDLVIKILSNTNIYSRLNINKKNIGFVKNFERALEFCTRDIIFFSDQDDVWDKDKIDTILNYFEKNSNIAGITHDAKLVDSDRIWYGTYKNIQFQNGYGSNKRAITGALSAIRKEYLEIILPIPNVSGHDIWIDYIFSFFKTNWLFVNESLGEIRRHESNTSEWIVNSFAKINKLDVMKEQFFIHPAKSYHDRLTMNSELYSRLEKINSNSNLFDVKSISLAIFNLRLEKKALLLRQSLADEKNKFKRYSIALKLLFSGNYKYFNGVKSFVRDIFRN